jgi:EAL and modified HD-GYP domain-containing signal transduction protein
MALGKFLKRLLTGEQEVLISDNPFAKVEVQEAQEPPKATLRQDTPAAILHRDEIIDGRGRIAGYRFYVSPFGDDTVTDGRAFVDALKSEAVSTFAQRRLTVIPLTMEDWRGADFRQFIAPHTVFLIQVPFVRPLPGDWLAGLAELKASGVRIALQDATPVPGHEAALAHASLVFIDYRAYSLQNFERLVKAYRQFNPGLAIAADGISSWPERRMCLSLNIDFCLGGFSTTVDEEDKSPRLNQSRLVLIELVNLLRREAELDELVATAKRDPGVAVQLVAMANSPMAGLNNQVAGLDQAIMVVGREMLYRWLTISMFRVGGNAQRDEALLELAMGRARFLELLGLDRLSRKQAEELFLVGLLSLLDSLLSMPMTKVVEKMNLSPAVVDVLLRSEGVYGRYLLLALAVEKGRTEIAARQAASLGLSAETVDRSALAALSWAQEAMSFGRA